MQETIKTDRKLQQRLVNAVTSGRTVQMGDILKHELSPIPLSLAKPSGDMNTTTKAELIAVLTEGVDIPYEISNAGTKTCVLIDGHAVIQSLGTLIDVRRLGTTQMFSCKMPHIIFQSIQEGLMWYSIALGKAQTRL